VATLADIERPSLFDGVEEETRPRPRGPAAPPTPRAPRAPGGAPAGGVSLEQVVARVWDDVRAAERASCLVCGGELAPRYGSGSLPVGASCGGCGSELT
jgi:hypothetical protein